MRLHKFCLLKCLGMLLQQLSLKEGDQESGHSLLCKQMSRVSSTLFSRQLFKIRMFFSISTLMDGWKLEVFQKLNFDLDPMFQFVTMVIIGLNKQK